METPACSESGGPRGFADSDVESSDADGIWCPAAQILCLKRGHMTASPNGIKPSETGSGARGQRSNFPRQACSN